MLTLTTGGVMSGMLEMGSSGIEIPPTRRITMAITIAKIGRSMKMELKPPMAQSSLDSPFRLASASGLASASVCGVTGNPGLARSRPFAT